MPSSKSSAGLYYFSVPYGVPDCVQDVSTDFLERWKEVNCGTSIHIHSECGHPDSYRSISDCFESCIKKYLEMNLSDLPILLVHSLVDVHYNARTATQMLLDQLQHFHSIYILTYSLTDPLRFNDSLHEFFKVKRAFSAKRGAPQTHSDEEYEQMIRYLLHANVFGERPRMKEAEARYHISRNALNKYCDRTYNCSFAQYKKDYLRLN